MILSKQTSLTTQVQVMFFDTDTAGVVHNIAYLRFVETTRTLLAVQLGLEWKWMQEKSIFPVILKTEIDYHAAALVGDLLDVDVQIGESTGVRFWCHFKIMRPADKKLIVSGKQALAFVKTPEGKPLRLPKNFPTPFLPQT